MKHWLKTHKMICRLAAVLIVSTLMLTMTTGCNSKKETGEDKDKSSSVAVNSNKSTKNSTPAKDVEKKMSGEGKDKKEDKKGISKENTHKDTEGKKDNESKKDLQDDNSDKDNDKSQSDDKNSDDKDNNNTKKPGDVRSYSSYDNTCHGFYFTRNDQHKPAETDSKFKEMFKDTNTVYLGDTSKKVIYLTFDEGYENGYTARILDVLKANKVKAAFFVTGDYVKRAGDLVKRMLDEGHIVGNHTQNHPSMPGISDDRIKKEINDLADNYAKLTGEDIVYFRPPKGEFSHRTLKITSDIGYKTVFWSWAYADWDITKKTGLDEIYNKFMANLHNGEIVLLHAVSEGNANALDRIIKAVKEKGYEFKTLDDIK